MGASLALEAILTELSRTGGNTASAQNQMQALTQLQRSISNASPADLAAMRGEIAAAVTQTHAIIEQGRTASGSVDADDAALANLASRAQAQATAFMRDLHQYDGLLQFDSAEQERAYREREEEYRKRVEAGTAQGTPDGELQASGAAYAQAVDLAAHGGSADPTLMRRVDELAASTAALRAGIIRDGGDVSKFDADMRADLRAIMKSKGKSDAEIDALLAAHPGNPIDAMKAFAAEGSGALSEQEIQELAVKARDHERTSVNVASKNIDQRDVASPPAIGIPKSVLDAVASLKGLDLALSEHEGGEPPSHGVDGRLAPGRTTALS